jgi:hypothetical protein
MTTSSDQHQPTAPNPGKTWGGGEHWYEMTATLSTESKEAFGRWMDQELAYLEDDLERFITPNSVSRRRR